MADSPLPERHVWVFRDPDTGEERHYVQRELTMDGEVELFALIGRTVQALNGAGYDWVPLRIALSAAKDKGPEALDWGAVARAFSAALLVVPTLGAEVAIILLGIFATDGHGQRNPAYADEAAFIRKDLRVGTLMEMLRVFAAQNDYDRLLLPFRQRAAAEPLDLADSPRRRFATGLDLLVSAGYGTPEHITRHNSWREYSLYLDVVLRRRHEARKDAYVLAGGRPDDFPEYGDIGGPGMTDDEMSLAIEQQLEASPFVHHVRANPPVAEPH